MDPVVLQTLFFCVDVAKRKPPIELAVDLRVRIPAQPKPRTRYGPGPRRTFFHILAPAKIIKRRQLYLPILGCLGNKRQRQPKYRNAKLYRADKAPIAHQQVLAIPPHRARAAYPKLLQGQQRIGRPLTLHPRSPCLPAGPNPQEDLACAACGLRDLISATISLVGLRRCRRAASVSLIQEIRDVFKSNAGQLRLPSRYNALQYLSKCDRRCRVTGSQSL